jgi:hypothetical protein
MKRGVFVFGVLMNVERRGEIPTAEIERRTES